MTVACPNHGCLRTRRQHVQWGSSQKSNELPSPTMVVVVGSEEIARAADIVTAQVQRLEGRVLYDGRHDRRSR